MIVRGPADGYDRRSNHIGPARMQIEVKRNCNECSLRYTKVYIRRLLENYCVVLLTNRAPPQISNNRPDMRLRALFVTSRAAWRWNRILLARENVFSTGPIAYVPKSLLGAQCMSSNTTSKYIPQRYLHRNNFTNEYVQFMSVNNKCVRDFVLPRS